MSTAAIPDRKTRKLAMLVPAATVGHLPRRRSWLPGSRILLALFFSILLLPSFVWVFLDRSVWPWDQAWYGEVTVQLYSTLRHEPGKWLQAMIAAFGTKPPAIAWIGQWFVPFGKRMGSIDLALHLSVLLIQFLTLVMVWRLGREVFPERSRWLPAIGCLFVGSAPLFIGLSHQYFPEPLQNLAVLWIFYIALAGHSWTRLQALSQLIAAAALAMGAKSSSPIYCLLPGVMALSAISLSRSERPPFRAWRLARDLACLALSIGIAYVTFRWYAQNLMTMLPHLRASTIGTEAFMYGSPGDLFSKICFWLSKTANNLFLPPVFALISLTGLTACVVRCFLRAARTFTRLDALAAASIVHVVGSLAAMALSINEETRYLLPLLPSFTVLLLWTLSQLPLRAPAVGITVLFVCQWVTMHAMTLGLVPVPRTFSPWLLPVELDATRQYELEQVGELIADEPKSRDCYMVVGVALPWINHNALSYHAEKRRLSYRQRCYYMCLGHAEEDDAKAWAAFREIAPLYFITLDESHLPKGKVGWWAEHNHIAQSILEKIRHDPSYSQLPLASELGIVVFARRLPE